MQAIILAAGCNRRMGKAAQDIPKCLIELEGKTILERIIENLLFVEIDRIVMTVGYLHKKIRTFVRENFPDLDITYLFNSDYENNNNSYSLWMTRKVVKGGGILLDSDIVFDARILKKLFVSPYTDCLAVCTNQKLGAEEIKVTVLDGTGRISEIGKDIDPKTALGESIGIERFSGEFMQELYRVLDRRILKESRINEFYEASFQEMIQNGHPIYAMDIGIHKAAELDFPEDVKYARKNIIPFI